MYELYHQACAFGAMCTVVEEEVICQTQKFNNRCLYLDEILVSSSSTRARVRVEELEVTCKLPKFNNRCL
jgi:hypothetical protein